MQRSQFFIHYKKPRAVKRLLSVFCTYNENIRSANRTPLFFIHFEAVRAIHPQSKTVKNRAKYRPILEKSSEKGMGIGVINEKNAMGWVGQVAIFSAMVCIQ